MPPRATWKGHLKISLVTVPVRAYTASSSSTGQIHLNQLHDECNSRIRYKKVCPIHGEVPSDEIVSGYEHTKGQYVVIDPAEIDTLRSEADKAINVEAFVPAGDVDPVYFTGKTYYLLPNDPIGQKPYALIHQAMADSGQQAVAQVVLSGKEHLVLLRPIEDLLAMTVLSYESHVKKPSSFSDDLTQPAYAAEELELTRTLMQAMTPDEFDLSAYQDRYTERLRELIEAKVEGKQLVTQPDGEEPEVINLMEALKQSVARATPAASTRKVQPTKSAAARRTTKAATTKKKAAPKRKMTTKKKKKTTRKKTG